jgi:hypothetical protein
MAELSTLARTKGLNMEYQTQNVREIQKRIRLLEKAERDLDALFRKERLVIAALYRSTKEASATS